MKKKLKTIALCLLISGSSYSQHVLIDSSGDTLVTITLSQMDRIYVELLQKDSLMEQSEISSLERRLLIQIVDSADKDIKSLKTQVNSLRATNRALFSEREESVVKVKRNRTAAIYGWSVAFLAIFLAIR